LAGGKNAETNSGASGQSRGSQIGASRRQSPAHSQSHSCAIGPSGETCSERPQTASGARGDPWLWLRVNRPAQLRVARHTKQDFPLHFRLPLSSGRQLLRHSKVQAARASRASRARRAEHSRGRSRDRRKDRDSLLSAGGSSLRSAPILHSWLLFVLPVLARLLLNSQQLVGGKEEQICNK